MRVRLLCAALLCLGAGVAFASALQVTPDGKRTLINKDVDGARWAIAMNEDDDTVTGNVYLADGSSQFLFCTPLLTDSREDVKLDCSGAGPCDTAPCLPSQWTPASDVALPISFFRPPAGPTPTPAPTAALRAMRGSWRFTYAADPAVSTDYSFDPIKYQFGAPLLIGADSTGAAVSVALFSDVAGGPPPFQLAMLAPGATSCLFYVFDQTSAGSLSGLAYVLGVDAQAGCLGVAPGQESFALTGERTADAPSAQSPPPVDVDALNRALHALLPQPR
jgi:hypothetical protein